MTVIVQRVCVSRRGLLCRVRYLICLVVDASKFQVVFHKKTKFMLRYRRRVYLQRKEL